MNYIDLFAGCGGVALGFHKAGIEGVFAVEKNKDAFSTLEYNLISKTDHFKRWPKWLPQKNWDINELIEQYRNNLMNLRGKIDIVAGGPPCQGFSLAGLRKTDDMRNQLMHSYIEFVKLVEPKILIFENVHGFTVGFKENNIKGKPYSEILMESLKKLGYQIEFKVITMSDYGVPQNRKRFILFATRGSDIRNKSFFDFLVNQKEEFLKNKKITIPVNVKQAIGDLERSFGEDDSIDSKSFKNGKYGAARTNYQRLMRDKVEKNMIPDSHRFAKHKLETISTFQELMQISKKSKRITPAMELVKGLKKRGVTPLKENTICPTITSIPDDFIHYKEPRIMTVREHARIQSFPDDYKFKGPYTTGGERRKIDVPRYTQVANAVPPLFSEQMGRTIIEIMKEL